MDNQQIRISPSKEPNQFQQLGLVQSQNNSAQQTRNNEYFSQKMKIIQQRNLIIQEINPKSNQRNNNIININNNNPVNQANPFCPKNSSQAAIEQLPYIVQNFNNNNNLKQNSQQDYYIALMNQQKNQKQQFQQLLQQQQMLQSAQQQQQQSALPIHSPTKQVQQNKNQLGLNLLYSKKVSKNKNQKHFQTLVLTGKTVEGRQSLVLQQDNQENNNQYQINDIDKNQQRNEICSANLDKLQEVESTQSLDEQNSQTQQDQIIVKGTDDAKLKDNYSLFNQSKKKPENANIIINNSYTRVQKTSNGNNNNSPIIKKHNINNQIVNKSQQVKKNQRQITEKQTSSLWNNKLQCLQTKAQEQENIFLIKQHLTNMPYIRSHSQNQRSQEKTGIHNNNNNNKKQSFNRSSKGFHPNNGNEGQHQQDQQQIKDEESSFGDQQDAIQSNTELNEAIPKSVGALNQQKVQVFLLQSVYQDRPPTIFFTYPKVSSKIRDTSRIIALSEKEALQYNLMYKTSSENKPYKCVTSAFDAAGFQSTRENEWNGYWGGFACDETLKKMNKFQKINHFPGCWNLGRKDLLWMRVSHMKRKFNEDYNFVPKTYLLKTEYDRFMAILEDSPKDKLWILKPVASCCGQGISVSNKKMKISEEMKQNYLVSEYIENPHLINDVKYDLRIYVLASSYDPLRLYIYNDGLTRFATEEYNTKEKSLKQRYVHLTNYSVNKYSEKFVKNKDSQAEDKGSKWSLIALKKKLESMGINVDKLFDGIKDIIIKTCISAEPFMLCSGNKSVGHRNNCFELYGFDILIDANLKPWLIEVNVCPSLSSTSPLDKRIKATLISDILNLVGFYPYNKKKFNQNQKNVNSVMYQSNYNNAQFSAAAAANNNNGAEQECNINQQKKTFSKNINDVKELSAESCLQILSADDWELIFETDEENYRRGDFERIFPCNSKEKNEYYSQFFEFPRYNNYLIWRAIESQTNFLNKICKKIYTTNV